MRDLLARTTVVAWMLAMSPQPLAIPPVGGASQFTGARAGQVESQEAKPRDQRVTGKVLDRDGKAVDKAEVRFDGPKKDKVFTNVRGEFSFSGPAGDYAVVVKAGSREQNFAVHIDDNQMTPSSTLVIDPPKLM